MFIGLNTIFSTIFSRENANKEEKKKFNCDKLQEYIV